MSKIMIGDKIRTLRKKMKLTQEQLAEKADISVAFLGEVERNEKSPGLDVFANLVIALNTSADYLLKDELPSGQRYVDDETLRLLENVPPKHRKAINDMIEWYLKNIL